MSLNFIPEEIELLRTPEIGEIEHLITPNRTVWVKWQGVSWSAKLYGDKGQPIPKSGNDLKPGDLVVVLGRCGTRLLINPA